MSKVVGFVIGAALIVVGVMTGNVGLIVQGTAMIVTQAIVDLTAPKTPSRQASEMTIALGEQPRVMLVGETFTPGSLVDGFNYGGDDGTDWECLIIRLADHKCAGLKGFFVNDEYVRYSRNGDQPRFKGQFELYFRSDTSTQALPSVITANAPGWKPADVGTSGCDVTVCYKADKPDAEDPVWPGGRPHFGFVVKGKLQYDPRLDDTVAGGSGPHRWDDPDTWEWSENAVVCWYNYERGVYANDDNSDQTKLLVGRGLTIDESPPENVLAAANLCDEDTGRRRFETRETTLTLFEAAFSPDFTLMILRDGSGAFELWYIPSRTLQGSGTAPVSIGGRVGVQNDGTMWSVRGGGGFYVDHWNLDGDLLASIPTTFFGAGDCIVIGGIVFIQGALSTTVHYLSGGTIVDISVPFTISSHFTDGENTWVAGNSGTTLGFYCVAGPRATELQTLTSPTGSSATMIACNPAAGSFVCVQNNDWYLIDDTTFTASTPVTLTLSAIGDEFERVFPGETSVWIGWSEVDFATLTVIKTVTSTDWVSGTTFRPRYDRVNNAIIADDGSGHLVWRFLGGGRRYYVAGPIYSTQDFLTVEQMFAAATAGNIITHEGQVLLEPGQAKSVVATFTDNDLLVGGQVSWNQAFLSESNQEWLNTVVANYVEPDQKWNSHDAPVLRVTADITADGKPREAQITLRLVRYQDQALAVGEINRRLGRLWGRASVKLGPRFCEIEEGDWVSWQSARYFAGATKTFQVQAYSIDKEWKITLTLREIAANVFDVDSATFPSDQSNPQTPRLPPPRVRKPSASDWTLTGTTLSSSGASVPILSITGAVPTTGNVEAIIVEYWKDDGVLDPIADSTSIPWIMNNRYPPSTTSIEINSLVGGATYYVALSYVVSGIRGRRLVLGPVTMTDLDVSGQAAPNVLPIDLVTGTTYTLTATDFNRHKRFTNASGCTVTVPKNATAAYPIGGRTRMTAATIGAVVLVPEDGTVTLDSRDNALTGAGEKAVFEVEKVATNEWDVLGDVTP